MGKDKKNTPAKKTQEKKNRNQGDLHQRQQAKDKAAKNFLGKANIEDQHPFLNKKTRDKETSPKETKDDNVLVEGAKDHDDILIKDSAGSDLLDQDKDKIHEAIIGFCVDYFEENGFTDLVRILEKKFGYFNKRHFEDLVQHGRWKPLEEYLSHFFDISESTLLLSKIATWAFMDDLKRRGLPLPEPKWFQPDYPRKASIISSLQELARGNLKMRDELKLPQELDFLRHLTRSQLLREGSDLVGAHRRPPGERKDEYKRFGKITIFRKILGEGKCTKVYDGMYENKPAAIKCIDSDCKVTIRKREVSNLIQSEGHENVVKYYGVEKNENEHSYFIALEKCSFSLHDLFDKEKNFGTEIKSTWDHAYPAYTMMLGLIKDMIKGLDHLHSRDLIHRGLKPTNIMIKEECGKFCAKLSDMGLSKRLGGASSTPNTPVENLIDDRWKSPEQKRKDKKVGKYVDLYSLGLIIYYCLTGGKQPQDDYPIANMENYPTEKLLFVLACDFPEAYDIVLQLMSPQKYERPSTELVLNHLLFWDAPKRNDFMRRASDWLDKEREDQKNSGTKSRILNELEKRKGYIFGSGCTWNCKIDPVFVEYLQASDPHINFRSVFDLVRVVRNKSNHFLELPENVKDLIPGRSADRVEEYFVRKFPKLLLEVYKIVRKFWKEDATLKLYFS